MNALEHARRDRAATQDRTARVELVREHIRYTTGTTTWYRHWLKTCTYTDGVAYLAELVDAHWLVDAIAAAQVQRRVARERFQLWRLRDEVAVCRGCEQKGPDLTPDELCQICAGQVGPCWVLDGWTDTPGRGRFLHRELIHYSDFPSELLPLKLYLEEGGPDGRPVLMLPEER